jgi:LmbE family N-acetylglucosaminyl deacetylase
MTALNLATVKSICFIGAHSDDIEIGCGGLLLAIAASRPDISISWNVFSGGGTLRQEEAELGKTIFTVPQQTVKATIHAFQDGHFPNQFAEIKAEFESLKATHFDLILTHYRHDRHQDHKTLSDLAYNTWRNHMILEYEIIKYDGDLGNPNIYLPLTEELIAAKADKLIEAFGSQRSKNWFDKDTFSGLARLRGVECQSKFAEAFHLRKATVKL